MRLNNGLLDDSGQPTNKVIELQIIREVQLLNNFDFNKEINEEFEKASLMDLENYTDL